MSNDEKIKNLRVRVKFTAICTAVVLALSYPIANSSAPENDNTLMSIIEDNSDNSVLNGYLIANKSGVDLELVNRLDKNYTSLVDISTRINDLHLDKIDDLKSENITDEISISEIYALIRQCEAYLNDGKDATKSEEAYTLACKLKRIGEIVNFKIQSDGFKDLAKIGDATLKALVANSYNLPPESINQMEIVQNKDGTKMVRYDSGTEIINVKFKDGSPIVGGNYIYDYANNVFRWNNLSYEPTDEYNKERNDQFEKGLSTTKMLNNLECDINNGILNFKLAPALQRAIDVGKKMPSFVLKTNNFTINSIKIFVDTIRNGVKTLGTAFKNYKR